MKKNSLSSLVKTNDSLTNKISISNRLFAYLLFIIIIGLFCGIYALLIYYGKIDSKEKSVDTWSILIGVVSFFLLGMTSGMIAKKNGLIEGLLAALVIILIVLFINLILQIPFVPNNLVKIATYLIASSLGGIIGVNMRK